MKEVIEIEAVVIAHPDCESRQHIAVSQDGALVFIDLCFGNGKGETTACLHSTDARQAAYAILLAAEHAQQHEGDE